MRIEVWVWLNAWPRPSSYKTAGVGVVTETKLPGGVQTLAKMSRCQPEGPMLQVFCLRGVCVSYTLLLVLLLPELGLVARPRCGVELIADLEFVCGDRGFYRGRARNGGSRSRGNGIVEQCCIKGCDLQHLEQYCAKPSRGRRQAPAFPLPTREAQFQMLFLKQYQRFLELNPEKLAQRMQEQSLYLETLRNPTLLNSNEKISNPPVCL
ncbi:insulin-like growth factor 3 [Electrophorus electricus]|uniref:insulin-like growth factor 3 n=1 Tax=Electrophorus electricus TaxID=8005 RepID=UPI0015CFDE18|nr:insulin-like growth factor 3 [Electrophorus electricus]